jgi:S-adenosylhomocysteine hydrolase
MSASFTNQVLAQLDLKDNWSKYEKKVYSCRSNSIEEVPACIWDTSASKLHS